MKTYRQLKESILSGYQDYKVTGVIEFEFNDIEYLTDKEVSPSEDDLDMFLSNVDSEFSEKYKNNYFAWILAKTKNSLLREDIFQQLKDVYKKDFFTIINNFHELLPYFCVYSLNGDGDEQGEYAENSVYIIDENNIVIRIGRNFDKNGEEPDKQYKQRCGDICSNLEKIGVVSYNDFVSCDDWKELYNEYCEEAYGGEDNALKIKGDLPEPAVTYTQNTQQGKQ